MYSNSRSAMRKSHLSEFKNSLLLCFLISKCWNVAVIEMLLYFLISNLSLKEIATSFYNFLIIRYHGFLFHQIDSTWTRGFAGKKKCSESFVICYFIYIDFRIKFFFVTKFSFFFLSKIIQIMLVLIFGKFTFKYRPFHNCFLSCFDYYKVLHWP